MRPYTRLISDFASQYESKGYDVILNPGKNELPDFLKDHEVDMIAKNQHESVIVEVKKPDEPASGSLIGLARLAKENGWRLQVISASSRADDERESVAAVPLLSQREVEDTLSQAEILTQQGFVAPAMIMAWTAFEALVGHVLKGEEVALDSYSPATILEAAQRLDFLQPGERAGLGQLAFLRNAMVHGRSTSKLSYSDDEVLALIGLVRKLVKRAIGNGYLRDEENQLAS